MERSVCVIDITYLFTDVILINNRPKWIMDSCAADLLKTTTMSCLNRVIANPLFQESEALERLMDTYNIKPVADLFGTGTIIHDDNLSFLLVSDSLYIMLLKKRSLRLIIRDNTSIYTDSIMKSTWSLTVRYNDDKSFTFRITSSTCTTYLFYVKDGWITFNPSIFGYKQCKLKRALAVTV